VKKLGYYISPERQEKIIKQVSSFIVNSGLANIVNPLLEAIMPWGEIVGPLSFIQIYIPLTAIFGDTGRDLAHMVGLDYRKYVPHIIQRINQLVKEKEALAQKRKPQIIHPKTVKGKLIFYLKEISLIVLPIRPIRWLWHKLSTFLKKNRRG
jgi:hypothetical protein